jgi:hypothetical protein
MKYTDLSKEEWNQFQYSQAMTELENFLLRMIIKFYEKDPSNAEDAFSGLYNHLCVDWIDSHVALEAGIDHADLMDLQAEEEMQELDPRDRSYVDDFGDPCS